jgi:RNA polymerase sigma-70 factor (ECF subfamily)
MNEPMSLPLQASAEAALAIAPSSFAEAYRDYAQRVARWAHNLGGHDLDVEDVVQEVFIVVSRKLPGYVAKGSFTSWLFEITRKITANHRRRQGRQLLRRECEDILERLPSQALDPAAELERRLLVAFFYRALDQLPEKYRTVFALYELDSLSTQAISELCRLNLSTVKVRLARARARFMHAYQKLVRKGAGVAGIRPTELADRTVTARSTGVVRLGKEVP